MGTDRSLAYQGACPCGSGTIEVYFCTPDHPWPTKSYSFERSMTCEECTAKFTFQEQGNQYGLAEKREIKDKQQRYASYKAAQAEFLNSVQAKEVVAHFISLLGSQRSVAAVHRLLQSHRLVHESYGTFVKKWKGAEAWVESHIAFHPAALSELAKMVGLEDGYLLEAVSKLKRLWVDYQRPLTFHGGPLFDISRYR